MTIDTNFSEVVYKLDENKQIKQMIDWTNVYGTLPNGMYRIIKDVYTSTSNIRFDSSEFEIE